MAIRLAVDAMGGDFGPRIVVPAVQDILLRHAQLSVLLFGDQNSIQPHLEGLSPDLLSRIQLQHTSEFVKMDDSISTALRQKRQSSMRLSLEAVKNQQADACVSAGNTGALMALGRMVLKTCEGIERPAIMGVLPTAQAGCYMLDLGANVGATAQHLYQFAEMAHVVVSALTQQENPRIRLLNIGEEEIKGNDTIREAHGLLKASSLNYLGFIEGDGIFKHQADIVVCDGLHGNIALKSAEGVAHLFAESLRAEFSRNPLTQLVGLAALPVLKKLKRRLNPAQHNGAPLVGLAGTVIKSHGSAEREAFAHALEVAIRAAQYDIPALIQQRF